MLSPPSGSPVERRLIKRFRELSDADRETLMAFADFLAQRVAQTPTAAEPVRPSPVPRPDEESVVGAIKRLSQTYEMLDRQSLLDETSTLMSAHILQGRSARDVIDELESLFARHYSDYCDKHTPEG